MTPKPIVADPNDCCGSRGKDNEGQSLKRGSSMSSAVGRIENKKLSKKGGARASRDGEVDVADVADAGVKIVSVHDVVFKEASGDSDSIEEVDKVLAKLSRKDEATKKQGNNCWLKRIH